MRLDANDNSGGCIDIDYYYYDYNNDIFTHFKHNQRYFLAISRRLYLNLDEFINATIIRLVMQYLTN